MATGARATRLRSTFVVLQVALSLVLLVGAGLFLRTVQRAYAVDLGYRVDRMLVAEIDPGSSYSPEAGQAFYAELLGRLNGLPGVVAAGAARVTVLSGSARTLPVSVDGQPLRQDRSNVIPARANVVSLGYFEAMGIPVVRGRGFKPSDAQTSPGVAIVSRSLADRLWPNADPIGRILISMSRLEVVGVVPDTVYLSATERDPRPIFYVPLAQNYESSVTLHVRTSSDPLAFLPAVRQIVRDLDSRIAVTRPRRLVDEFDRSMTTERTMATFVGLLSGIALLLAAVGLYGVIAYATRQRTSEVGLRLALGATPASILTMIVLRGARLIAMGAVLGFAGAFAAMRYVRNQLFGVEPTDPLTWLVVSALLAGDRPARVRGPGPARHAHRSCRRAQKLIGRAEALRYVLIICALALVRSAGLQPCFGARSPGLVPASLVRSAGLQPCFGASSPGLVPARSASSRHFQWQSTSTNPIAFSHASCVSRSSSLFDGSSSGGAT